MRAFLCAERCICFCRCYHISMSNSYKELRKGQSYITAAGITAVCTEYRNAHDIDITYSDGGFRHSSWSHFVERAESPLVKKRLPRNAKAVTDHLGITYPSLSIMLKHYGVTKERYYSRVKQGWTLEETLTTKGNRNYKAGIKDHLGNSYSSERTMCEHYNIKHNAFQRRIKQGWSLEDALTKPVVSTTQECTDHLGNTYKNKTEMCKAWGVRRETVNTKLRAGISLKDALEVPTEDLSVEYNGLVYRSLSKLAQAAGVKYERLSQYVRNGMAIEEAVVKASQDPYTDYTNEEAIMNNGLRFKITQKLSKGYKGVFEDGTEVTIRDAAPFVKRYISHPTLKTLSSGSFAGFKTSRRVERLGEMVFYNCTCEKCGLKDLLTPQQMMEHQKTCTEREK